MCIVVWPQQSLLAQKFKPAEGSWECSVCMVNNKSTDDKCVACTTSRPTGQTSAPSLASGNVCDCIVVLEIIRIKNKHKFLCS